MWYNCRTQLRILNKKTDVRQFFWLFSFRSASSKTHQCRQKNRWPPNFDHIVKCENSWLPLVLLWFESWIKDVLKQNYGINYISYHRQTVIKFQIISAVVWEIFCKNKSNHIFTIFSNFNCFISVWFILFSFKFLMCWKPYAANGLKILKRSWLETSC